MTHKEDELDESIRHWNAWAAKVVEKEECRVAALPGFQADPRCAKCGSAPADIEFRKPRSIQIHTSGTLIVKTAGTMLYTCGYCKYRWETRTADAEPKGGEKPPESRGEPWMPWIRGRFEVEGGSWPVKWPPPGPFWITGSGEGALNRVIAWVKDLDQVLEFWPNAVPSIDYECSSEIRFTDEFPRPPWWNPGFEIVSSPRPDTEGGEREAVITAFRIALEMCADYLELPGSPDLAVDVPIAVRRLCLEAKAREERNGVTVLPDGSAFATASLPLPRDHWLYEENPEEPPAPRRVSGKARDQAAREIAKAARFAIRGATMSGKAKDFDPDAMVQNFIVAMLGRRVFASEDGAPEP